ncbi:MAG: TonB-dependent receptor [Sphingobium sp.]
MKKTELMGVGMSIIVGAACSVGAAAQEAQTAQTGGLQEIVVTAQKRSENMQKVPIAVTAVSGEDLASSGVSDMLNLQQKAPGLYIGTGGATALVFIRGVGTQNPSIGDESSVATYIDGVYQASPAANLFNLTNIDRVEVLKGPQGTLFGRNATGGLINIITRTPQFDTHVEGSVSFANHDRLELSAYGTTPLSDTVAIDLAGQYSNQYDGFGTNLMTGNDINRSKEYSLRSKLLIQPSDLAKITLAAYYSRTDSSFGLGRRLAPGAVGVDGTTYTGGFWDVDTRLDAFNDVERYGASARVDYDLGGADLVSITAYQRDDATEVFTQDAVKAPIVDVDIINGNRFFTQELQLLSNNAGRFSWIIGGFFMKGRAFYDPLGLSGQGVGGELNIYGEVKTTSWSAFAQGNYKITDNTKVTAGIRYSSDLRKMNGRMTLDGVEQITDNRSKRWSEPTWRLSLDHQFTPDVLLYASYNRGFKSGVFSTAQLGAPAANPEKLDAYEIGVKSTNASKTIRFNAAAFLYKYKDIQLTQTQGGALLILNAAKATLKGFDFEGEALLTENFSLTFGGNYVDSEYDEFLNGPTFTPNPAGGNIVGNADLSGNRLIRTPKFTGNLGLKGNFPIGDNRLMTQLNLYHSGSFFFEAENRLKQKSYTTLSGEISYEIGDHWRVWAFGRNLTNKKYLVFGESGGLGDIVSAAPGRLYGVGAGFRF